MSIIYPEATPVQGNTKVKIVLAMADATAPSLATEINAASSVDASFFLRDFAPTATQNKGEAPRRLGTRGQLSKLGNVIYDIPTLRYVYDPQADDTTDENKLKAAFAPGAEVYVVERKGLDAETDFVAAERAKVHHIRLGEYNETRSGDDEFAEYEVSQEVEYIEEPFDAVIAA